MSTEASFDNRGGRASSTPSSPLPPDILEILAQQQARMDKLLEQERARNRRELAKKLKAASKAQEGRIYKEMRRKVINEELPRIRSLLRQELTPLVMEELRAGNARAAPNKDRQDRGRPTSHHLDPRDERSRSPERVERQYRHRSPSRRQGRLEQRRFEESANVWDYERRRSSNKEVSETEQAILLPSEKQGHPRGLRRSSSEAHLDDEEENHKHLIASNGSKRVRTGPGPISMRRSPEISFQSHPEYYFPSRSPRRHIALSRAAQAYLRTERAIPSVENDQLKDAGRCPGYYTRFPNEGQGEGFMPSNLHNLPSGIPGEDRPLTPFVRQDGVGSEEGSLPDKFTTPSANSSAGFRTPHEIPPPRQPQEAENTVGLFGRIPHGWYASRTDILQKARDMFPHRYWGLSSEFRPLLVFYDQRHILIECEGLYFFWHEPSNSLERINRPKELQEILKQMDHGTLLPRETSVPAGYKAPLALMELVRAENLLYWSTPVVIHRRQSSIDRAVSQSLIRLGSESSVHESNVNDINERDEENGDNPDTPFGRLSDDTRGVLDHQDSREPGYDASSEDNAQEGSIDHPAAVISPSFGEGTTLNNPIDLASSPSAVEGPSAYDRYTSSNFGTRFFRPDAYERQRDDVQSAPRHRKSKDSSDEEFDDGKVDWWAIKEQLRRDEENYP